MIDEYISIDRINDAEHEAFMEASNVQLGMFHKEILMCEYMLTQSDSTVVTEATAVATQKSNVLSRMLKAIGDFFKWIGGLIRALFQKIASFFTKNKSKQTPDQILNNMNVDQDVNASDGTAAIPLTDDSELKIDSINAIKKSLCVQIEGKQFTFSFSKAYAREIVASLKESTPIINNIHFSKTKSIKPGMGLLHMWIVWPLLINADNSMDIFETAVNATMDYLSGQSPNNDSAKRVVDGIVAWNEISENLPVLTAKNLTKKLTFAELKACERRVNKIRDKFEHFEDFNNTVVKPTMFTFGIGGPEAIEAFLKTVTGVLSGLAQCITSITNCIHQSFVVDASYAGKLSTPDQVGKFVEECVTAQIPPKYIAYNTWYVSNKEIGGYKSGSSVKTGQSRCVLIPKDKDVVYKFPINYFGYKQNKSEHRVYNLMKESGNESLVANIIHTYQNDYVIEMEKVKPFKHATIDAVNPKVSAYIKRVEDAFDTNKTLQSAKINILGDIGSSDNITMRNVLNLGVRKDGTVCAIDYGNIQRSLL